ncbi:MAG: phage holin family protein [Eggerthellaceae bacterium]|nr:phage holin family protein [Eggerthellaceae bacterium]
MNFIIQWIVCSLAVAVAAWIVPGFAIGMTTQTWVAVAALGLVLLLLNKSVKPLLQALSFPITILTLGVFYLVVNTLVLYLAAWLVDGLFGITIVFLSFGSAFAASIIVSLVSMVLNNVMGVKK